MLREIFKKTLCRVGIHSGKQHIGATRETRELFLRCYYVTVYDHYLCKCGKIVKRSRGGEWKIN